jgi:hypothetical protein
MLMMMMMSPGIVQKIYSANLISVKIGAVRVTLFLVA